MKINLLGYSAMFVLMTGILTGCVSRKAISPVNTLTFNIGDIKSIRLDYDADDICVLKSNNEMIILKEYMNYDKKSYYAKTAIQNGEILITEGRRPRCSGFKSCIEIYIPESYSGNLYMHSTSGTLKSELSLNLAGELCADTTSGIIDVSNIKASAISISTTNGSAKGKELNASIFKVFSTGGDIAFRNINADAIKIQTTNASTSIQNIKGAITYNTKGGGLTASDIIGSGSFNSSGDGYIKASFSDVQGNVMAYSKNGNIVLTLPNQLQFKFSATTKNGAIDTSFSDQLAVTKKTAAGNVGLAPIVSVGLETQNGDIKVLMSEV